jgi:large subunit ribosomal protein L3
MSGILGKKLGMTRVLEDDGRVIPITEVLCTPNTVVQVKTSERDGYPAIVLGFDAYHKQGKNSHQFKFIREFRVKPEEKFEKSQSVTLEALKDIKFVRITSISKGKGFQGVIKRHKFHRGPETHGSHHHREPGSAGGNRSGGGRIKPGKRYPGHMGNAAVTLAEVPIIGIDLEKNILRLKGPVPGARNSYVRIEVAD